MFKRIVFLVSILIISLFLPVFSAFAPMYDCISTNADYRNVIPVMKNNKWGFVNFRSKQIIPFKYSDIKALGKGFTSVELNNKWGVIDSNGKLIININYDRVVDFNDGYFITSKENKIIYIDSTGNEMNSKYPGYDYYALLSSKYIAVGKIGTDKLTVSWGIIDSNTGIQLIKPQFPVKIEGYSFPPALINENGLFGFIQNIKKNPDDPDNIVCGIIDKNGKVILPFEYECYSHTPGIIGFMPYFSDGLSLVQNKLTGKTSYIDRNGKIVLTLGQVQPVTFFNTRLEEQPFNFYDGMCRIISKATIDRDNNITYSGKWGFINRTGKIVVKMLYDNVSDFYNGYAAVEKNGKLGFINKTGKVIVPIIYDFSYSDNSYIHSIENNMISVGKKGKYGVINFSGKTLIPFSYDEPLIYSADNGLFSAKKAGKSGFVDKKNKIVIPLKYQSVSSFKNNISLVKYGNHFGAINKAGKVVIPIQYDYIDWVYNNKLCAYKGSIASFFDTAGKLLFTARSTI